jgi:hypothetical protein
MQITPLMMANGKIPQNFPATKGEFEHLTSTYDTDKLRRPPLLFYPLTWFCLCTEERYEHMMKSYGLPIKGDTAAKREALREFIGLTPAAKT